MVQKDILVSILINNYNNQNFLKKSIDSCLNQTYKNLEIIIFDDNSTDDSFEKAKKLIDDFGPEVIKYYIISHTETVSDLLEVALIQKESGLMEGSVSDNAKLGIVIVPLFETKSQTLTS